MPGPMMRISACCEDCRFTVTLKKMKGSTAEFDQVADDGDGFELHVNDGAHSRRLRPKVVSNPFYTVPPSTSDRK